MKKDYCCKVAGTEGEMQVFEATKGGQEGVQNTDRHRTKTGQRTETPLLSMVSAAGVGTM